MKEMPFFGKKSKNSVDNFNDTLTLDQDESGQIVLKFRFAVGKGTAPVRIPVEQMAEFIEVLEMPPKVKDDENLIETIRSSLEIKANEDGKECINFRTGHNRGSKIQEIPVEELSNLLIAMKKALKELPEALEQLNKLS